MIDTIKIPEDRKGVLIGKKGSVKKSLEERTKTRITIGETIEIEGEDPIGVMKAKDVIKAIGRGFSPEKAFRLLDDEYTLTIISLGDETENTRKRIFARIIGTKGKTRQKIEIHTNTFVSVYGKTVSIIGRWNDVQNAAKAVEMLIEGKPHAVVYKYLESLEEEGFI